jgi:foldase protein PrsA
MPITRFELDQLMYSKVGKEALDALITQKLVDQELKTRKISVLEKDIDARLEEIKTQLGTPENFNQILELQGVTQAQLREQIDYQLKLEKLVPVSTDSAKMQADISATLSGLRSKAKIWVVK